MNNSPKWIRLVFKIFLGKKLFEDIEGDVNELYSLNLKERGSWYANGMYFLDFLSLLKLHTTKFNNSIFMKGLISHHFLVAFRTFVKRKQYFLINMIGLVLAITSSMFIFFYVEFENNFDTYHNKPEDLYRLTLDESVSTPGPLAGYLAERIPEIHQFSRYNTPFQPLRVMTGNEIYNVSNLAFVDPGFFELFAVKTRTQSHQLLMTDNQIGLSGIIAKKHFGNEEAIGKRVTINDSLVVEVAFVFDPLPTNSHLQFDYLLPFEFQQKMGRSILSWGRFSYGSYFRLSENADKQAIQQKIDEELDGLYSEYGKVPVASLQNVQEIHTTVGLFGDFSQNIDPKYLNLLLGAAFLILILSTINFMNMTMAIITKRSKEASVKKAIGATSGNLRAQLLLEITLVAFISLSFSYLLIYVLTPYFNSFFERSFGLSFIDTSYIILLSIGFLVLIIILGMFPAWRFSRYSFQLAKTHNPQQYQKGIRRSLISFQFIISMILLIVTLVSRDQLNYIMQFDTGVNRENIVVMPLYGRIHSELPLIKEKLLNNPLITNVTATGSLPIDNQTIASVRNLIWTGKELEEDFNIHINWVAPDFPNMMGLNFIKGSGFSELKTQNEFIINRKAWEMFHMDSPSEAQLSLWGTEGSLVGIVENFQFQSFHNEVGPLVLIKENEDFEYALIKYTGDARLALEQIENITSQIDQNYISNMFFLNSSFEEMYREETQFSSLFLFFSGVALTISAIGLFGFIAFIAEKRMKEFSIRKMFGAGTGVLSRLVVKEFAISMFIACFIAWPAALYFSNQWLSAFSYRNDIELTVFVVSTFAVVVITAIAIFTQALKLVRSNPIETLKDE